MFILIGLVLGFVYIAQPVDAIRAPVDWLNTTMVEYTTTLSQWVLGIFPESDTTRFFGLLIAVATPGIAGLALNLIAPLARMARVIFSIGILAVSLGAWGTMEWHQALLFNLAAVLIGLVLSLMSGPIMEAIAGFFSVTLGLSQVRMLLFDEPSGSLQELMDVVASNAGILDGDAAYWVTVVIAFIPLALVAAWLVFRLLPGRRAVLA